MFLDQPTSLSQQIAQRSFRLRINRPFFQQTQAQQMRQPLRVAPIVGVLQATVLLVARRMGQGHSLPPPSARPPANTSCTSIPLQSPPVLPETAPALAALRSARWPACASAALGPARRRPPNNYCWNVGHHPRTMSCGLPLLLHPLARDGKISCLLREQETAFFSAGPSWKARRWGFPPPALGRSGRSPASPYPPRATQHCTPSSDFLRPKAINFLPQLWDVYQAATFDN